MNALAKMAKISVWVVLAAVLTIGCSPLTTLGFIFRDNPKVPPQFPLRPAEGPKKEKSEEISVLIVCDQRPGLPMEFAGADRELAATLVRMIPEKARANKDKIKLIPVETVADFQAKHPNWRNMGPDKIGKALHADCVIDLCITSATMYQPGTQKQLYEGKASIEANVCDLTGEKSVVRHYNLMFEYKPNASPDVSNTDKSVFLQGFLQDLATKLCWKHIEHLKEEEIAY